MNAKQKAQFRTLIEKFRGNATQDGILALTAVIKEDGERLYAQAAVWEKAADELEEIVNQ